MKTPQRYKPALGRPDVTPYAMMLSDPQGKYVTYEDYLKLKEAYDKLWEDFGRD